MKCPLTERGCGGCIELSVPYGEHLRRKQDAVRKLFPDALPIVGMENPCHYRGKVLSTFANGRSGLYSGIYAAGSHRVLSVRDCILHDRRADEIVGISREILAASGLTAYNEDAGTGTLRHMQLRRAAGADLRCQRLPRVVIAKAHTGVDMYFAEPGGRIGTDHIRRVLHGLPLRLMAADQRS